MSGVALSSSLLQALEDGAKLAVAAGWSRAQFVAFFADIAGATYDRFELPTSSQGGN